MPGVLVAIILVPWAFFAVYNIDNTVTSGDAYGFSIGDTRETIIYRFEESSQIQLWRIAYIRSLDRNLRIIPTNTLEISDLPSTGTVNLARKEGGDVAVNMLRLTLEDGRLTAIYRHRRLFELP